MIKRAPARAALAAGRPGTAFTIFMREVAGLRSPLVAPAGFGMNRAGRRIAGLVERQLDDNEAIDALGCRLEAYGKVVVPVLLLEGERSPRHLRDRTDALGEVLPAAVRVVLAGQRHTAERTAPGRVAEAIADFVARESGVPPRGIG